MMEESDSLKIEEESDSLKIEIVRGIFLIISSTILVVPYFANELDLTIFKIKFDKKFKQLLSNEKIFFNQDIIIKKMLNEINILKSDSVIKWKIH